MSGREWGGLRQIIILTASSSYELQLQFRVYNSLSCVSVWLCVTLGWALLVTILYLFLSGGFSVLRTLFIGIICGGEWRWHRQAEHVLVWRSNSNRQTTAEPGATTTTPTTTTTTTVAALPHSFAIKFFLDKTRPAGAQTDNGNTQQPAANWDWDRNGIWNIFNVIYGSRWHHTTRLQARI